MSRRTAFLTVFSCLVSVLYCIAVYADEPVLSAEAAIVIDAVTGDSLFEKNADARMYPASTTKILTAYLAVLLGDFSAEVTVSESCLKIADSNYSVIPLKAGETLRFEDLLYATWLRSGNEGANLIAETVGGSAQGFVDLMNRYAASLQLSGTHFANPHGLHDEMHFTTARDMAVITREALAEPQFQQLAATVSYRLPADNVFGARTLVSHIKRFLGDPESPYYYSCATGVKTGYTAKAGYCFVGSAEKNGVSLIAVVFHCDSYGACWRDTAALMEYGFSLTTP